MGSSSGKVSAPRSRSQHLEEPLGLGARRGGGDDLRLVSRAVNPSCNWDLSLPNWLQESEAPRLPRRGAGTGDVLCGAVVLFLFIFYFFLFIFPFLASLRLETAPEQRMPDPSAAPASSKRVYQDFFRVSQHAELYNLQNHQSLACPTQDMLKIQTKCGNTVPWGPFP